ncbi:ParA family protein [Myxococcota bacterium]|nr:ParA family protein [Myxococcota bacterium]
MSEKPPVLTFFNNKGGVGKTLLLYHLAWMYASLHKRVLAVDLDPQSNLTALFLKEDAIEELWEGGQAGATVFRAIEPLMGGGGIVSPVVQKITPSLYLLPGDVALSRFEETLSSAWPDSMGDQNLYRPMRALSAFWQVIQSGAKQIAADIVLVDVGPNLGAINRCALIATDFVLLPLGADLFSLQALKNLGPTLRTWRSLWHKRRENWSSRSEAAQHPEMELPQGSMQVVGYVCQQYGIRLERPVVAYEKWANRIPDAYRETVLDQEAIHGLHPPDDPECLAVVKHYRSLVSMGQEHHKPIFSLTSADGAIGSHANAVQSAKHDFKELARKIANKISLPMAK